MSKLDWQGEDSHLLSPVDAVFRYFAIQANKLKRVCDELKGFKFDDVNELEEIKLAVTTTLEEGSKVTTWFKSAYSADSKNYTNCGSAGHGNLCNHLDMMLLRIETQQKEIDPILAQAEYEIESSSLSSSCCNTIRILLNELVISFDDLQVFYHKLSK